MEVQQKIYAMDAMDGTDGTKETYLPQVRCETDLKERLQKVARRSVSPRLADHIRVAVVQYVAAQEAAMGIARKN
jgi:hypothetical protein